MTKRIVAGQLQAIINELGLRVAVNFLSPPFAPLWGAAGDHFEVHPLPNGLCCNPYTPEFQSRALPNLLRIAFQCEKEIEITIFPHLRISIVGILGHPTIELSTPLLRFCKHRQLEEFLSVSREIGGFATSSIRFLLVIV